MNHYTLFIEMNPTPEVLERVLRVTRHRGFTVRNMNMHYQGEQPQMAVTVSSDRHIDHLTRQLDKLFDVTQCRVQQDLAYCAMTASAANG